VLPAFDEVPMRSQSHEVFLPARCAAAFDLLVDFRNDLKWRHEMVSIDLVDGMPGQDGSRYSAVLDWYDRQVPHEVVMLEARPSTFIHFVSGDGDYSLHVRYRLEDHGRVTRLEAMYTLDMVGPLVMIEPFAWAVVTGFIKDDLPQLPEYLDQNPL
jgi:hypothetical protein